MQFLGGGIESVHRGLEAARAGAIDGFQRAVETLVQNGPFFQGKTPKDMVHGVALGGADPDTQARHRCGAKVLDD